MVSLKRNFFGSRAATLRVKTQGEDGPSIIVGALVLTEDGGGPAIRRNLLNQVLLSHRADIANSDIKQLFTAPKSCQQKSKECQEGPTYVCRISSVIPSKK